MADDKGGGGGGWEWGTLEVILAILLIVGLLDRISGRDERVPKHATQTAPTDVSNASDPSCGLMLRSPAPLTTVPVGGAITLTGETSGCLWDPTASVALYAQAVDAKGFPVSPYTTILPVSRNENRGTASFDGIVPVNGIPAAGTGYLILTPPTQESGQSVAVRVPIRFVR